MIYEFHFMRQGRNNVVKVKQYKTVTEMRKEADILRDTYIPQYFDSLIIKRIK